MTGGGDAMFKMFIHLGPHQIFFTKKNFLITTTPGFTTSMVRGFTLVIFHDYCVPVIKKPFIIMKFTYAK